MFSRCYGIATVLFLLAIFSAGCGGSSGPTPPQVQGGEADTATPVPTLIATPAQAPTATATMPTPSEADLPSFTEPGDWIHSESVDFNNRLTQIASIEAASGVSPSGQTPFTLKIGCSNGDFMIVTVDWISIVSLEPDALVTQRIDSQDAVTRRWELLTVGTETSLDSAPARNFALSLLGADVLTLRVSTPDGSSLTGVFNIRGVDAAIQPILEACPTY